MDGRSGSALVDGLVVVLILVLICGTVAGWWWLCDWAWRKVKPSLERLLWRRDGRRGGSAGDQPGGGLMSVRLAWFLAGWVIAGTAEYYHAPLWLDLVLLVLALFAASAATDRDRRRNVPPGAKRGRII
jgi:hypothetical protein